MPTPKKFQDIISPDKKSIRNIPLSSRLETEPFPDNPRGKGDKKIKITQPSAKKIEELLEIENRSGRGKSIWVVALIFIIFSGFVIISKFATTTVNLVVSAKPIALANTFKLSNNSTSSDAIDYDVLTLAVSADIPESAVHMATGTAALTLAKKATGTVTITNSFSTSAQILIKSTRLESPTGKIFLLDSQVTVPGQTTAAGKTTPGTVTAKITAEKAGDSYNVGSVNFTLPGLKSSPKYKLITAKSKTTIDGGSDATSKPVIDPDTLVSIKNDLEDRAISQIYSQKSDNYVLLPGALQESTEINSTSTATLNVSALLINRTDLANQIQKQKNLDINLTPGSLSDLLIGTSSIKVTLPVDIKLATILSNQPNLQSNSQSNSSGSSTNPSTSSVSNSTFNISINGTTTITNDVSPEHLKKQLAGLDKKVAEARLKTKLGVEGVLLEMWPWWVNNIPKNLDRITIKIENN